MFALISYDIEKRENSHQVFKEAMKKRGWYDSTKDQGILPNTTLLKIAAADSTLSAKAFLDAAEVDVHAAREESEKSVRGFNLERYFIAGATNFRQG